MPSRQRHPNEHYHRKIEFSRKKRGCDSLMEFVLAVQRNNVLGPMRRGFDLKVWDAEYARLGTDERDARLHSAGIRIHEKATTARAVLGFAASDEFDAVTKVRALVAVANHEVEIVRRNVQAQAHEMTRAQGLAILPNLETIKVRLRGGDRFAPDEVLQSVVDGLHFPLRAILSGSPSLAGTPKYAKIDWDDLSLDWNVGNLYQQLEQLWDDCLWNGYYSRRENEILWFEPTDREWQIRAVVSRHRLRNLAAQFAGHLSAELQTMTSAELRRVIGVREVRRVRKEGRSQAIDIKPAVEVTEESRHLLLLRAYANEPYYADLLNEMQPALGGASIHDLFNVWAFVRSVAFVVRESIHIDGIPKDQPEHVWFPAYAPVVKVDVLIRSSGAATGIEHSRASAIVEFLTYNGGPLQELWAQPLVPAGVNSVTPLFGSLMAPVPQRLVDVWLKQLNVDLGRRGPAFEQHVRDEIAQTLESHKKLPGAKVLHRSFRFRPAGDREEEIDVVLGLGNLVLVGEVKCMQHPTESKELAMHRRMVEEATKQIGRKAAAASKHREQFRKQLGAAGIEIESSFSVLPLVILNGAIHAGFPVDGIPVADMYIVRTFLSGEMADAAIRSAKGLQKLKITKLFSNPQEAATNASAYFDAPPQMNPLVADIRERWVSVGAISEDDWRGMYLTFEPHIDVIELVEGNEEVGLSCTSPDPI